MKNGLEQLTADPCIFINQLKDTAMYLALYVDDGLICGSDITLMRKLLGDLHLEFEITFREAEFFVGMQWAPWLKWLVRWIAEREVRGSNPREHQKVFHGPTSRECLTNVREL